MRVGYLANFGSNYTGTVHYLILSTQEHWETNVTCPCFTEAENEVPMLCK